jgi:hypothetical protein
MEITTTTGTTVVVTLTAYIETATAYRCYGVDDSGQYYLWFSFDRIATPVAEGVGTKENPVFPA